jgi:fumarylacetoacetase
VSLDETHDPAARSWVESANTDGCDFPLQNLPFGRFSDGAGGAGGGGAVRAGIAIGDEVLDLARAAAAGGWDAALRDALAPLAAGDLNAFMALGPQVRRALRRALFAALRAGSGRQAALGDCLLPRSRALMQLPCRIGDYTDFYTGIHHATAVGRLFRPDEPLLPNYKWVPIGYHGRSSSVVASGTPVRRPRGQLKAAGDTVPRYAPTARLDYELELGAFVGSSNELGTPVPIDAAEEHLFGIVILNDWSARDIQGFEYQPLGPFLSKNFATSISPWIVTMEALEPFRLPFTRPATDPAPLPHLDSARNRAAGQLDVRVEALLQTRRMQESGLAPQRLSLASSAAACYWTLAQLLAHHTSGGCNLQCGDLLGTGTLSGPEAGQAGSLLELSAGGRQAIRLPGGEERRFLEDGDRVVLKAWCERDGARRIGLGECSGLVLPA